jgi:hypothetical protein
MANRYFNKQVAESRKPLAVGGTVSDPKIRSGGPKKGRPSLRDKIKPDPKGTGKSVRPNPTPKKPSPKLMEIFKKRKQERDQKRMKNSKPESPERKKRQADYMKKHGKKPSSRKTLSVTNSYKKEVEGLK